MTDDLYPSLTIDQSRDFAIKIACTRAQEYSKVGMTGLKEYFFALSAKVRHPTGHFLYEASDLSFGEDDFERFMRALAEMHNGASSSAQLTNVGEMFALILESQGREMRCTLRIREFQPGTELTTLNAAFKVDYDLFVNKLAADVKEFLSSLKSLTPRPVACSAATYAPSLERRASPADSVSSFLQKVKRTWLAPSRASL